MWWRPWTWRHIPPTVFKITQLRSGLCELRRITVSKLNWGNTSRVTKWKGIIRKQKQCNPVYFKRLLSTLPRAFRLTNMENTGTYGENPTVLNQLLSHNCVAFNITQRHPVYSYKIQCILHMYRVFPVTRVDLKGLDMAVLGVRWHDRPCRDSIVSPIQRARVKHNHAISTDVNSSLKIFRYTSGARAKVREFESKRISDFRPGLHTSLIRLHQNIGDTSAYCIKYSGKNEQT